MAATLDGANKDFADRVNRLNKDLGTGLASGFRSAAEQQALYDEAVAKHGKEDARNWAALPGHSNHEKGIAADLTNYKNVTDAQLAQYGLYRPMSWEPWHVEPIGSRSQSSKDAYTNPQIPGDPALTKTMNNLGPALDQLLSGVGKQSSAVGQVASAVGSQVSAVGDTSAANATQVGSGSAAQTATPGAPTATGGSDVQSIVNAIGKQESGNDYNATNKDSGAFGKYQIMPANWPSWAKEAGLPANAPKTPENQDRVAQFKIGQYVAKYGAEGAMQAWYGGEGSVGKNVSGGAGYPTSDQYVAQVKAKL